VTLVSLVDEQVAGEMAPTIAAEVQGLLKGAAPHLQTQQVGTSPAFPDVSDCISQVQSDIIMRGSVENIMASLASSACCC
jgi:hypothetical protein